MFFKISQYSQENTCVDSLFKKNAGLQACNFIKKRLQNRCFHKDFAKFFGTPLFTEHLCWLLLEMWYIIKTNSFHGIVPFLYIRYYREKNRGYMEQWPGIDWLINLWNSNNYLANIYLFKVSNKNNIKGVKYIQG